MNSLLTILSCLLLALPPAKEDPRTGLLEALETGQPGQAMELAAMLLDGDEGWQSLAALAIHETGKDSFQCSDFDLTLWNRIADGRLPLAAQALLLHFLFLEELRCAGPQLPRGPEGLMTVQDWTWRSTWVMHPYLRAMEHAPQALPGEPPGTGPAVAWTLHTRELVMAWTRLCPAAAADLVFYWNPGAPGTLWLDGRMLSLAEAWPADPPLLPARASLAAGCHELSVALAPQPGAGRAVLYYRIERAGAEAPKSAKVKEPGEQDAVARAAALMLTREDAALDDLNNGAGFFRPGAFFVTRLFLERTGATKRLEQFAAGRLRAGTAAAECAAWRWYLQSLFRMDSREIDRWLSLWPAACARGTEDRLLLAEVLEAEGLISESSETAAALLAQGVSSCRLRRLARRLHLPLGADADVLCETGERAGTEDDPRLLLAVCARELEWGLAPLTCGASAERLWKHGRRDEAVKLAATQDDNPEGLWTLGDMLQSRRDRTAPAPELSAAAAHPLAGSDLRLREGTWSGGNGLLERVYDVDGLRQAAEDSDRFPDSQLVVLLDDLLLKPQQDGRISALSTRVIRINGPLGAQLWEDPVIPEDVQVTRLEVRKTGGAVVEPQSISYGDAVSLPGLQEGDEVLLQFYYEDSPVVETGSQFCLAPRYLADRDMPTLLSTYRIVAQSPAPFSFGAFFGAPPAPLVEDGVLVFRAGPFPAIPEDPFGLRQDDMVPRLEVCTRGFSWARLSAAMYDSILRIVTPGPLLKAAAKDCLAAAAPVSCALAKASSVTRDDSSLFFRRAEAILDRGEGSPAVVLMGLLVEMGYEPDFLLAAPPGNPAFAPSLPSPGVFTEPLLRLNGPTGETWLDPWSAATLPGLVRPFLERRRAMLLSPSPLPFSLAVPAAAPQTHLQRVTWVVRLAAEDRLALDLDLEFRGLSGASAWRGVSHQEQPARERAVEDWADAVFPGVELDHAVLRYEPGRFTVQARLHLLRKGKSVRLSPRLPGLALKDLGGGLQDNGLPLLLEGQALQVWELKFIVGDEHGRVELAPSGRQRCGALERDFGVVRTACSAEDGQLTLEHRFFIRESELAGDRRADVRAFAVGAAALSSPTVAFYRD